MKRMIAVTLVTLFLAACTGTYMTKVENKTWKMDAWAMCQTLNASNQADLTKITAQYGDNAALKVAPLFKELDGKSFNICRTRIARERQNEQIVLLRAEYKTKIEKILCDFEKK